MFDPSNTNPIGEVKQIDDKMVRVYDKNGAHKFDLYGTLCDDDCTEDHVTITNQNGERNTYDVYGNRIKSIKLEEEKNLA